tara:strand:+ start:113 stop:364 length:252 start_codon:yes stop_codon:yes gene_type:complete
MSIWDRLNEEWDNAFGSAQENTPTIEPTEDEKHNGWDAESLAVYRAERMAAQTLAIDPSSTQRRLEARPAVQNNKYSPFRWRS